MPGFTIKNVPEVWCFFSLLFPFGLDRFLNIEKDVYEEAVKLIYANLVCPIVPEDTEPILVPALGNTYRVLPLHLSEILDLPNEGDHVFLSAYGKLPGFSKIQSYVFSQISIDGDKNTSATRLKPDFASFSNGLLKMLSSMKSQRISPPLIGQVYVRPRYWIKLNVGCIICESMRDVHASITDPNPQLAKLSLPFGMLLTVIFNH